jgi:hypothetical protein
VPVFLRWLIVEIVVVRILRHLRRRSYPDRVYPMVSQRDPGSGRRIYAPAGNYRYVRRRRLSGCSGCLVFVAAMTLGLVLLIALVHWAW